MLCRQLPGGHRQAVLPQELRIQVINWSHLQLSHLGAGKVIAYLQTWAWWPKMGAMTKQQLSKCHGCIQKTRPANPQRISEAFYVHAKEAPGEEICIDFCGPFPTTEQGFKYVLVIIDSFSSFVMYRPMTSKAHLELVRTLWADWICVFGRPKGP